MNNSVVDLITVASWEERFSKGTAKLFCDHPIRSVHVFYVDKYESWSLDSREQVTDLAKEHQIVYNEVPLESEMPSMAWSKAIIPTVDSIAENAEVLVDVTTMPREVIWQVFWLLSRKSCVVRYVYHRPEGYGDWLSRDPGKPRLAYKMSGLSKLGARTALVVLAGYDVDRVRHLVATYEPAITLLGLQENSHDPQNAERMSQQRMAFEKDTTVHVFGLDAYALDHGEQRIRKAIQACIGDQNLILTSMGPKLSAIALFKMHWSDASLGLVYLPANEFNREYSFGIGESVYGQLSVNHEERHNE